MLGLDSATNHSLPIVHPDSLGEESLLEH